MMHCQNKSALTRRVAQLLLNNSNRPPSSQQLIIRTASTWSHAVSYTSPESDFCARSPWAVSEHHRSISSSSSAPHNAATWSKTMSFTSPESDFASARSAHSLALDGHYQQEATSHHQQQWSRQLSFASPESDFTLATAATEQSPQSDHASANEWSHTMSFASPESDFTAVNLRDYSSNDNRVPQQQQQQQHPNNDMDAAFYAWCMASSPETAFGGIAVQEMLDDRMKRQLQQVLWSQHQPAAATAAQQEEAARLQEILEQEESEAFIQSLLPKTWSEAYFSDADPRAIVITSAESPFEIVHVNSAWESLCGYDKQEAVQSKNLGALLQGPQTNRQQAQQLLDALQHGHAARTVLTNYTKTGRPFRNLVRVAPLRNEQGRMTHFVGVLQEI